MPYIKQKDVPFARFSRLLKGYDMTPSELSRVLDCNWHTAKTRLDHPERFTLRDLAIICSQGHIPMDEIRDAIVR